MSASLAFVFPIDATYEQVCESIALHFGGAPVNLSTGEVVDAPLRDATAVFTGTSQMSVTTGSDSATSEPSVTRDVNGLPWDERIHSSSKSQNADGSWRGRKGVAPPVLARVKAELLSVRGAAAPTTSAPVAAPAPVTPQANLHNTEEDARNARLAYAREQAFIKAGAQPCGDEDFLKLQRGQLVTVSLHVNDWFKAWQAAFNAAYGEYAQATLQQTEATIAQQTPAPVVAPVLVAQPEPVPAAPCADTFPGFAAKYAAHIASPVLAEVLATLGVAGFAALAAQETMIPAVRALLAAKGIV